METQQIYDGRGEAYSQYFLDYPHELVAAVRDALGSRPNQLIAEVGAGTGSFTRVLLNLGHDVFATEPSQDMLRMASAQFANNPRFHGAVAGGNSTGLQPGAFDAVVAAQNIHWYYDESTYAEFRRILKPRGKVLIINADSNPKTGGSIVPVYRHLTQAIGKLEILDGFWSRFDQALNGLFVKDAAHAQTIIQTLRYSFEGALGMLCSIGFFPKKGEENYHRIVHELQNIFAKHAKDGMITFTNHLQVICGELRAR